VVGVKAITEAALYGVLRAGAPEQRLRDHHINHADRERGGCAAAIEDAEVANDTVSSGLIARSMRADSRARRHSPPLASCPGSRTEEAERDAQPLDPKFHDAMMVQTVAKL